MVDEAVVKWPSGIETAIPMPAINQYHNIVEAPCVAQGRGLGEPDNVLSGETVTLTATGIHFVQLVQRRGLRCH